jgi:hypothetical protein
LYNIILSFQSQEDIVSPLKSMILKGASNSPKTGCDLYSVSPRSKKPREDKNEPKIRANIKKPFLRKIKMTKDLCCSHLEKLHANKLTQLSI